MQTSNLAPYLVCCGAHNMSSHTHSIRRRSSRGEETKVKEEGYTKMALSLSSCSSPLMSLNSTSKPGLISDRYTSGRVNWITDATIRSNNAAFDTLRVHATEKKASAKVNSILCSDCEGDGCKKCGQCQGKGINIIDHFNGQFKAGGSCWLCRGKKEVLCGSCNGAGFLGGFMSTFED